MKGEGGRAAVREHVMEGFYYVLFAALAVLCLGVEIRKEKAEKTISSEVCYKCRQWPRKCRGSLATSSLGKRCC